MLVLWETGLRSILISQGVMSMAPVTEAPLYVPMLQWKSFVTKKDKWYLVCALMYQIHADAHLTLNIFLCSNNKIYAINDCPIICNNLYNIDPCIEVCLLQSFVCFLVYLSTNT